MSCICGNPSTYKFIDVDVCERCYENLAKLEWQLTKGDALTVYDKSGVVVMRREVNPEFDESSSTDRVSYMAVPSRNLKRSPRSDAIRSKR